MAARQPIASSTAGVQPGPDTASLVAFMAGRRTPWGRFALGVAILLAAIAVSVTVGSSDLSLADLSRVLLSQVPGLGVERTWPDTLDTIVWDIRLPRAVLGALLGAGLGLAGATYQGLFRNPLADPYLIGAAAGAGLGAAVALQAPVPVMVGPVPLLPLMAFVGSLGAVTLAYLVGRRAGGVSLGSLLLAGVAIASVAGAVTSALMLRANPDVRPLLSWLLGGFNFASWQGVAIALPYLVASGAVMAVCARALNALQLGEEEARSLGVAVERIKATLILAASLATAAAVSVSGVIGFVGLIAPHTVRLIWGPDHRALLPMAALAGGAFLALADTAGRLASAPTEIPVGVVTALCGGPFFLWLVRRRGL